MKRRKRGARRGAGRRVLDELLVLRAQEGSREAFQLLVTRWQERLWRHAYRLTGRDDAAWDVLQESWMAVTRGLGRLEDPGAFRRWAYTIVTRAATDRQRRLGREEAETSDALDDVPMADDESDDRERAVGTLRAALARLPGDQRGLLSLRYLEGFELWELAEILEVPEGTVKSRLHTARNHMKEILERMER
jgi:RNA polymerase sigma-70 factor (ECF subfamily)